MKTTCLPLLALLLAGPFAGCASSSSLKPLAGHMLETKASLTTDLPLPDDDASPAVASRTTAAIPVKGLDESQVLQTLGSPGQRLTPEVWIYWRYYSREQAAAAGAGAYDTLIVAFARGKVSEAKLVNGELLRRHLAGWSQRAPLNEL